MDSASFEWTVTMWSCHILSDERGSNDVTCRRSPFVVSTNREAEGEKEATLRRAAVRQKRAFWQEQGFPKRWRWL